jgi:hypothetical protein
MRRILVSTILRGTPIDKSGKLYIYDWDTEKVVRERGMLPVNARICESTYGGSRGLRGACIDEEHRLIYVATSDTITVLNYDLEIQYTIQDSMFCNLHEIRLYGDRLYIASCGNDAILWYNVGRLVKYPKHKVPRPEILWSKDEVGLYVNYNNIERCGEWRPNSLCWHNGKTYVVFATTNRICRLDLDVCSGERKLVDIVDSSCIKTPHNIMFSGDNMFYNSSFDSMLYKVNKEGVVSQYDEGLKKPDFYENTQYCRWGWLRGMDIVRNNLLVGSSPYGRVLLFNIDGDTDLEVPEVRYMSQCLGEPVSSAVFFKEDW